MSTIEAQTPQDQISIWSQRSDQDLVGIVPTKHLLRKGVLERVVAAMLLLICAPLIVLMVILVRLTSRGSGFYRQVRVGQHGQIFVMYKIRSMVEDAEVNTGPVWTWDLNDPRITSVGAILRRLHLDELPQLYNVVKGEMSLFGPRPERPEMVHVLAERIPGYLNRLAVKPGINGLAQVNLPPDTDLESVRRKLVLDMEYIQTASYWLEFRMFCWTGLRLLGLSASLATRLCRLGCNVQPVSNTPSGPVTLAEVMNSSYPVFEDASIEMIDAATR